MASQFRARRNRFSPRPAKAPRPAARSAQPSGDLINGILRYHDVVREQGSDIALLRVSEDRLREPEVRAWFGEHAATAAGVSILYNQREDEIIRVLAA
ncbi:hypothetical protein ACO2Q0_01130 [Phenylobacterium sp. VNQ135]|uniref:hypothetical protein n=1 Tax=Phenylobacterium sp. VNQ135 TaxID=3400922 RepID=UPI003BFC1114